MARRPHGGSAQALRRWQRCMATYQACESVAPHVDVAEPPSPFIPTSDGGASFISPAPDHRKAASQIPAWRSSQGV